MQDNKALNLLVVPYFKQDLEHSCAPAVVRMILAFYGLHASDESLREILETDEKEGSHNDRLTDVFKAHDLHTFVGHNGTLEEVQKFLDKKIPVIVNYLEPQDKEGHYAVVVGLTDKEIVLNDPWHGEGFSIRRQEFVDDWHSKYTGFSKWYLAVSNFANGVKIL